MEQIKCPECEETIDRMYHAKKEILWLKGGEWFTGKVVIDEYSCPECKSILDYDKLVLLGSY